MLKTQFCDSELTFFFLKIYLFKRQTYCERGKNRHRNSPNLVHFLEGYKGRDWVRVQPGTPCRSHHQWQGMDNGEKSDSSATSTTHLKLNPFSQESCCPYISKPSTTAHPVLFSAPPCAFLSNYLYSPSLGGKGSKSLKSLWETNWALPALMVLIWLVTQTGLETSIFQPATCLLCMHAGSQLPL